jgi:glycosyltransferase involved in cell wall biosynthesis
MRIALICPDASSNALVRTYPIAKVLARRHDIQLVGFRFGAKIFPPYSREFSYDIVQARAMPAFVGQVEKVARRIEADAIYVFKPLPSSLWAGLRARHRLRVPLLLDIEDWEVGWYRDVPLADRLRHLAHLERPNGLAWTWITERLISMADHVFVVSRFLQRRFGGSVLVHGADTELFDPARWPKEEARQRVGLPSGRYILFAGAPAPHKGLDELLLAVERIGLGDVRLLIVGSTDKDPSYPRRLSERHGDRLVWIGPRPHEEMPMFLAAADLVALPQRLNRVTMAQVPGKVFEAMAMARPILATAVSDLPEILDGAARVVEPGSIEALTEGLADLLRRPSAAEDLGHAARARCIERYSWDTMERTIGECFAGLRFH